ncbi:MAG: hypothetical protein LQ343_007066 [Gyalolechia ehrenbergii]|nr:MAG: hypothetical protein LQ343_007066 [Gyalolechia ehrenbergii]
MLLFHRLGFVSLFLSSYLIQSTLAENNGVGIPSENSAKELVDRETPCIALGTCFRGNTGGKTGGDDKRTAKCSPDQCPKFCQPSQSQKRNFLGGPTTKGLLTLRKRFFKPTKPEKLVNEVLKKPYTSNLSEDPNQFEWHLFDDKEYASAIKGLSGCTAIIAASSKGVFSSHLWEEDRNTNEDLKLENYKTTISTLKNKLSPHKDDLSNGEAFIMLPSQTTNSKKELYEAEIVSALKDAVKDASGLDPKTILYVPLDWKKSTTLGTNERGTAAVLYDPKYKPDENGEPKRAYRVYLESKDPVSERTF